MIRNNVTRMLDSRQIQYTAYTLPKEKLGAQEVAEILGVPIEQVFKTIVIKRKGRGKHILAVVPGSKDVYLKTVARAVGEKKVLIPSEREAEQLTGLQAGGISPLALLNHGFQVIVDKSATEHDEIHISGGQRGLNIRLPTAALVALTNAKLAKISAA